MFNPVFSRRRCLELGASAVLPLSADTKSNGNGVWPTQAADRWKQRRGWMVGCNFIPSTAINQLEMWQAATFDLKTIERELGWAAALGFRSVRIFLHDLLWQQDHRGFLERIDAVLDVCQSNGLGAMLVLFDSVWHPHPKLGVQAKPKPHVHNSGWVQSPGADLLAAPRSRQSQLGKYVNGVVAHFSKDVRVHAWDIWNEPDQDNKDSYATLEINDKAARVYPLLKQAFAWARAARPTAPLTSAIHDGNWQSLATLRPIERLILENSDVISFHSYSKAPTLERQINELRTWRRPIVCTEFMARPAGSTFKPCLEILKRNDVSAYCWGFVSGKTQTIYPWDSWQRPYSEPPAVWFHDVLRPDGSAYDDKEVAYIKALTAPAPHSQTRVTNPR